MTGHANILSITLKVPGRRKEHYPTGNLIIPGVQPGCHQPVVEMSQLTSEGRCHLRFRHKLRDVRRGRPRRGSVQQCFGERHEGLGGRPPETRSADGQARTVWAVCHDRQSSGNGLMCYRSRILATQRSGTAGRDWTSCG